jgi:hypothetical protein
MLLTRSQGEDIRKQNIISRTSPASSFTCPDIVVDKISKLLPIIAANLKPSRATELRALPQEIELGVASYG